MNDSRTETLALRQRMVAVAVAGDFVLAYLAMALAFFIRFGGPMEWLGFNLEAGWPFDEYQGVILLGAAAFVAFAASQDLYDWRFFLRLRQMTQRTIKAATYWFVAYLCISIVFEFEPTVSRLFMGFSWILVMAFLAGWKRLFCYFIGSRGIFARLSQKVIFLGWNPEAQAIAKTIQANHFHPYLVSGWVSSQADSPERITEDAASKLGTVREIESVFAKGRPDILIVADLSLSREELNRIVKLCEVNYIQLKILPTMFQVFVSGLRLETISNFPLLGVGDLPIQRLGNRMLKRTVDIVGALLGLVLSAPVILACGILIRREDKGPVFFGQERIGRNHRPFKIWKLRSMKMGSELSDHQNQSTLREDPRVLRIGAFMRQWNLDELPQFWNVLKGEMSLVGPRPERTHFVGQLSSEVNFYNNRHYVKPGMTGWAQINGLRGDTDLSKRIRHDIYYIENWSLWMDVFCLFMTFFSRKNAY